MLTLKQVAQRYQCSVRHIERLVAKGEFPKPIKLGVIRRWSVATLDAFDAKAAS